MRNGWTTAESSCDPVTLRAEVCWRRESSFVCNGSCCQAGVVLPNRLESRLTLPQRCAAGMAAGGVAQRRAPRQDRRQRALGEAWMYWMRLVLRRFN